jgi:5-carboxymethyl-2-hydroxymuconate isomerase
MPHLVITYSSYVAYAIDWDKACRTLCDALIAVRDENGAQVFPTAGTRVFAVYAAHDAVADGSRDAGFAYFNLRMAKGRSDAAKQAAGEAITAVVRTLFEPVLANHAIGLTIQIDEGHEVFDAKVGNLHALYAKPPDA